MAEHPGRYIIPPTCGECPLVQGCRQRASKVIQTKKGPQLAIRGTEECIDNFGYGAVMEEDASEVLEPRSSMITEPIKPYNKPRGMFGDRIMK